MILKDYQKRTLATVSDFLRRLAEDREKDRAARSHDPEWGFDWVERAWEKVVPERKYRRRRNGLGEHLPFFCLKIPTGGGKTLLATRVIDLVNVHFRQSLHIPRKKTTRSTVWRPPIPRLIDHLIRRAESALDSAAS